MKSQIETVTPEQARKMLEANTGNRAVRAAWVRNLAGMIVKGEWVTTHQGIAFDETGRLVDGQHRLLAIVEAGKSVKILVTRGLPEGSYKYLDGGRARVLSDRISLVNDHWDNVLCTSLVRAYLCSAKQKHSEITMTLVEDTFLALAEGFQAVTTQFRQKTRGITRSDVGAALAVLCQFHPQRGENFTAKLISGEGLTRGSPILCLREFLLSGRVNYGTELYWKTMFACKKYIEGETISALHATTSDFAGNKYAREEFARTRSGLKSAMTKQTKKILASIA